MIRLTGKIEKGKIIYNFKDLADETFRTLEGKEFELTIREKRKKVTLDQHAYYRKGIIGEALKNEMFGGWDKDEVHDFFSDKFLGEFYWKKYYDDYNKTTSQITDRKVKSTSNLSTKEMSEYMDKCIRWLAEHDIVVLTPEQFYGI